MSTARSFTFAAGVSCLSNTYAVDGRVSWHPPKTRGFGSINCYLVQAEDVALVIDTGVTVHGEALQAQIRALLQPNAELSILALRQGEFDSICNLIPIAQTFGVSTVYGQFGDAPRWADIHPQIDATDGLFVDGRPVGTRVLGRIDEIVLGSRRLEAFRPLLRLLSTHWIYDETTRTLFTSDSFGYVVRDQEDGPWQITDEQSDVTSQHISEHLISTRYWWLSDSDVTPIRRDLSDIFERYEIEHVAPAFGAVLSGGSVVARHFALMDEALANLGNRSGPLTLAGSGDDAHE